MKYLKMLGIAAVAAMALMAFAGAGTASATTLCTTEDEPDCTMTYTKGTKWDDSLKAGTSAKLTNTAGEVIATCTELTIKGTTTVTSTAKGVPFPFPIESMTWGGCSQTTDTIKNGTINVEWIEGTHNASVSGEGSEVTVNVFGVSCTYGTGTGTKLGTEIGGETPEDNFSATVTKTAGGFLCPNSAIWDADLVTTEPHALFFVT